MNVWMFGNTVKKSTNTNAKFMRLMIDNGKGLKAVRKFIR